MSLELDERRQAMLLEMGVRLYQPPRPRVDREAVPAQPAASERPRSTPVPYSGTQEWAAENHSSGSP